LGLRRQCPRPKRGFLAAIVILSLDVAFPFRVARWISTRARLVLQIFSSSSSVPARVCSYPTGTGLHLKSRLLGRTSLLVGALGASFSAPSPISACFCHVLDVALSSHLHLDLESAGSRVTVALPFNSKVAQTLRRVSQWALILPRLPFFWRALTCRHPSFRDSCV